MSTLAKLQFNYGTQDNITGCKQCGLALSDYNRSGFCTKFCENEYNGVSNKITPERRIPEQIQRQLPGTPVRKEYPRAPYTSELRKFLDRAKHNPGK